MRLLELSSKNVTVLTVVFVCGNSFTFFSHCCSFWRNNCVCAGDFRQCKLQTSSLFVNGWLSAGLTVHLKISRITCTPIVGRPAADKEDGPVDTDVQSPISCIQPLLHISATETAALQQHSCTGSAGRPPAAIQWSLGIYLFIVVRRKLPVAVCADRKSLRPATTSAWSTRRRVHCSAMCQNAFDFFADDVMGSVAKCRCSASPWSNYWPPPPTNV